MKKLLAILTICLAASLAAVSCDSGASAGADPDGRHPAAQEEQPQGREGDPYNDQALLPDHAGSGRGRPDDGHDRRCG